MGVLLGTEDSNSTLIEAVWIFLGGDVKVNSEDEVRPGEVQVHGQSHLQGEDKQNMMVCSFQDWGKKIHTAPFFFGRQLLCGGSPYSYHVSLLGGALLDPAQLSERQLSGDGGGQRQLVVGTGSSLQFQT